MSRCQGRDTALHQSLGRARPGFGLFVAAVAVVILAGVFAGPGGAVGADVQFAHNHSVDEEPPTVADGTRVSDTEVRLTITDNHDVDESTISADQFASASGSITGASVSENGSNASVVLELEDPVDVENLTIMAIGNTQISDTAGNILGTGDSRAGVDVGRMDGVLPNVFSFEATNATGGPATIEIEASERLSAFNITVGGVGRGYLTEADFTRSGGTTYTGTYLPPADGPLRFTLFTYTDTGGNTRELRFTERVYADVTPPDVRAGVDLAASSNLSLVFDAGDTTDSTGVANYTWDFGDGATATGERVEHAFAPGTYTVALEATDRYGNTATETLSLNLSAGSGDAGDGPVVGDSQTTVTVRRSGESAGTDAVVAIDSARAGVPVATDLTGNESALARHGAVSLTDVSVTPATNLSLDLAFSMGGPQTVGDAATAAGARPLAGLTVVHTLPDGAISNATLSLAVERSRLRSLGISPENVSVRRFHDGRWNSLPTTVNASRSTEATVHVSATSPGFSRFAVLGANATSESDGAGTPDLSISEVSLERETIQRGESAVVSVTVANDGTAAGSYTGALAIEGDVVARATSASVEPGDSTTFAIQHTPERTGEFAVSVNGTDAGTLTIDRSDDASGFVVTNVTVNRTQVTTGEPVAVNATVRKQGRNPGIYTAGLAVNGSVVATAESPPIPGNESRTVSVAYRFNETGQFPVSINGTVGETVTVSSGGGLFSLLPLGILQPLFLFVVVPVAIIWGGLKALAIYLGY